ncbi:MAG: hypothetical protein IPG10_16145 [Flavobacteriales bacterium]|jgi:hypothetical protein|nr:hypothetical protein [Flavobacteriales bacterium]MBK7086987.1 hypothetical protein [Flavobacteriales bacterium]MBK9538606.1 hypothetical protein [Flavobacteriales bacterium]
MRDQLFYCSPSRMGLSLSSLEGMLKVARCEHPRVMDQLRRRCQLLQASVAKDEHAGCIVQDFPVHCRGVHNNWRAVVHVSTTTATCHALMWWYHKHYDAVDALQLQVEGRALHFDSHFFRRWGKRTEKVGVMITNMAGFFKLRPDLRPKELGWLQYGKPATAAAIPEGLVYGNLNGIHLISCNTFVNVGMMRADQLALWERLRSE